MKSIQCKWVIDWLEVLEVWLVLIGINLNREETLLLQHAGFHLQERLTLLPHWLFSMSKIFKTVWYDQPPPKNPNAYIKIRDKWTIWRIANAPTTKQWNKWKSARNIRKQIIGVTLLPFPSLDAVVALETRANPNKNIYQITMDIFSLCTCPNFVNMVVFAIGSQQQYVNCKHLHYLFRYFCKMDVHNDKFIHAPSYSFNELKLFLVWARIITILVYAWTQF